MSMRIRDLHDKLGLLGTAYFIHSQMKCIAASNKHSLTRPVYIEALLKHSFFENNFGESFDEIMSPNYAIEDAKANIRFTEYGRTNPEAALLTERAHMQSNDIISLMGQAEKWIESKDKSYTHQGNLIAFGKNFEEYFEMGESYGSGWDRIVIALQTFIDEQLLPEYPHSPQLKKYCTDLLENLYPDKPPAKGAEEKAMEKKLKKKMDDLQWYFDNFCVGVTQVADVIEGPPVSPQPQQASPLELQTVETPEAVLQGFDGKLMVAEDGSMYANQIKMENVERCVGKTMYALLKKKYGCVSCWDIAKEIDGENVPKPSKKREKAIRRYVSTLRLLLKSDFPAYAIGNERGMGYTLNEPVKQKVATA